MRINLENPGFPDLTNDVASGGGCRETLEAPFSMTDEQEEEEAFRILREQAGT